MATADIGGKARLYLSHYGAATTTATNATNLFGEVASVSSAVNAGEIDTTAIGQSGNVFQSVIGGKKNATLTLNLNYDGSDTQHDDVMDSIVAGRTHAFRLVHPQETNVISSVTSYVQYAGLISDFNISDDPESKHSADLTVSSVGTILVQNA